MKLFNYNKFVFSFLKAPKGDGCRRTIGKILEYWVDVKEFKHLFAVEEEPVIRLRFAGEEGVNEI